MRQEQIIKLTKDEDVPKYPIADWEVEETLKSRGASKEELRDAVFPDLLDKYGAGFLPSSCSDKKPHKKPFLYILLLAEFGQKRTGQGAETEKM